MFRSLSILFLLYNVSYIEGASEYKLGYSFNELADGWMKLHEIPATWSDARFVCKAEGAVLASPLTHQLREAMVEHASSRSVPIIFTGVHATYSKGAFTSVDGVPLSKMPISWLAGEPNNYMNSESCLAMKTISNGSMGDVSFHSRTGKCYKLHRRGLNWSRAYMTCMAEGGHLAVINSEEEFTVLRELFNSNPDNVIFSEHTVFAAIGFSDPNDGGSWRTIHDETLKEAGFERWQTGEPNNASQPWGELCGVIVRGSGHFNDAPCFWSLAFICEKKPEIFDGQ